MKCTLNKPDDCFYCPYADCIEDGKATEDEREQTEKSEDYFRTDEKKKKRLYMKNYYRKNREYFTEYNRKYREKHRDELNAYRNAYYYAHRTAELERQKAYDDQRRAKGGGAE